MPDVKLTAKIDTAEIDEAIKKANRLVELLREASNIIGSLSGEVRSLGEITQSYTNNLVIKDDQVSYLKVLSTGRFHGDIGKC